MMKSGSKSATLPRPLLCFASCVFTFLLIVTASYGQQAAPPVPPGMEEGTLSTPPAATIVVGGTVRTTEGSSVPGATVRLANAETNKSWVSWTDESGKFQIPGLPPGRYRMEVSQLGFVPATQELVIAGPPAPVVALSLRVATLAEVNTAPEAATGDNTAAANP